MKAICLNFRLAVNMFHYRVFIGYPFVGKSKIINCLEQRVLFKSGGTSKCDLKHNLQKMDHNGTTYREICFKSDTERIKEVAQIINEIVEQNIKYQIFFVVETKNQKIREKDLNAIQLVLQKTKNISYNVIINKLAKPVYEKFCRDGALKLVFPDGRKMKPASYLLLQHEKSLDSAEDKFLKLERLDRFVADTKYIDAIAANGRQDPGKAALFPNDNN